MSEHAKYAPSSFDRVIECPGSVRQSAGMESKSSKFAEEGTVAHAMAAELLGEPGIVNLADWPDACPNLLSSDEEKRAAAKTMLEHVMVYTGHVMDLDAASDDVLLVEYRVRLTDEIWGTADAIVWSPGTATLFVRDLKYGAGIAVEVEDNTQLKMYALMALVTCGFPAKTVDIGIVQPRCPHHEGPIRTRTYEAVDLLDFWADVDQAVVESKKPDAPLRSGDHCRFCPAAATCPELKTRALETAKAVFAVGNAYEPADLAKTLDMLPVMEAFIKNVREFAYSEAEQGRVAPGYKLVEKVAVRKWREDIADTDLACQLAVAVEDLYAPRELLGVTAVQKLAPGKNDKERSAALEPFVNRVSSGHSLVPASDRRQPVRLDAKAAFALPMES